MHLSAPLLRRMMANSWCPSRSVECRLVIPVHKDGHGAHEPGFTSRIWPGSGQIRELIPGYKLSHVIIGVNKRGRSLFFILPPFFASILQFFHEMSFLISGYLFCGVPKMRNPKVFPHFFFLPYALSIFWKTFQFYEKV